MRDGLTCDDANVTPESPGKTEVVLQCALNATLDTRKLLIACPIGPLVAANRKRIPLHTNIVVETIHSSFKITRRADEVFIPPGRLRHFDLIIFDEVSQQDAHVWDQVRTALAELTPEPFVVFVGDFQQLQPIDGEALLQEALDRQVSRGRVRKVQLQQHAAARYTDERMPDFLNWIRTHQPSRALLLNFFDGRKLSRTLDGAVAEALQLERTEGRKFTFLTVTNRGASALDEARVRKQFPEAQDLASTPSVPVDPAQCLKQLVFLKLMQVRFTKNLDKDRGFVNGALGTIVKVLNKQMFVVETEDSVHLLAHMVCDNNQPFVPAAHGYAMTIRRGQGSTLEVAALHFD